MNLLLYLVLMVAASAGLKLIPARLKYNKSQYQNISGNKFFKTVFDKGNYGEFLTFCMLEKIGESNILTNIYLPQKDGTTTEIDLLAVNSREYMYLNLRIIAVGYLETKKAEHGLSH